MRYSAAILAAGILISGSIIFVQRYEIVTATSYVYRLDRWTGTVVLCVPQTPDNVFLFTCGSLARQ